MTAAMMIALAAGAAAWVLAPLLRNPVPDPTGDRLGRLRGDRDASQAALRDLELDYAMGKISREDYHILRRRCEAEMNAAERSVSPDEVNTAQNRTGEKSREDALGPGAVPTARGRPA